MDAYFDQFLIDSIPTDVVAAAQKVSNYFIMQGVNRWELLGVCSRNHAFILQDIQRMASLPAEPCPVRPRPSPKSASLSSDVNTGTGPTTMDEIQGQN